MRCFIAINFNSIVEKEIEALQEIVQEKIGHLAKIIPTNHYHITLSFLGDISDEEVNTVKSSLKQLECKSMCLSSKKIISFPNKRNPRILSLGFFLNKPYQKLIQTQLLIKAGIISQIKKVKPVENTFIPHITLFRIKNIKKGKEEEIIEICKNIPMPNIDLVTKEIVFFKSTVNPKGPIYDKLIGVDFN